jgi:hypothetical protein
MQCTPQLTHDTAPTAVLATPTASALARAAPTRGGPTRVRTRVRGDALAHEHREPGRGLEYVVDALNPERGALLVRACANLLRDALRLRAGHERARCVLRVRGRAQVGFTAHEQHGNRRPADGADFFYPLLGLSVGCR